VRRNNGLIDHQRVIVVKVNEFRRCPFTQAVAFAAIAVDLEPNRVGCRLVECWRIHVDEKAPEAA